MALTAIDTLDLRSARYWEGNHPRPSISDATINAGIRAEQYRAIYEQAMRIMPRPTDLYDVWDEGTTMTQAAPEKLVEPVLPPKPESLTLPVEFAPLDDLSEYDRIAADLGFAPDGLKKNRAEMRRRDLIGFLLDNGMPVYRTEHVKKYMDGVVAKANHDACVKKQEAGGRGKLGHDVPVLGWKWASLSKYKHAIPIDILKRAQAIKAEHPTAEFEVSDYEVVNPDPFIAVRIDGCERVVFGVWDEPGFKAIGKDAAR